MRKPMKRKMFEMHNKKSNPSRTRVRLLRSMFAVIGAVLLSACATGERQFGADSVRQERYQMSQVKMPGNFADLQQSLFRHRDACDIYFRFSPDPQQVHFATLTYKRHADDDPKEAVFADLTAYTTGNIEVVTYAYYARNKALARSLIRAFSAPDECPDAVMD